MEPNTIAINWNTIILAFIGFLVTTVTSVTALYMARVNKNVDKIHEAVNSERTAMVLEVKTLRDQILEISKEKSRLEEKKSK